MPIRLDTEVNENTSCKITGQIQDYDGSGISSSLIDIAQYTLRDLKSGNVINGKAGVDFKSNIDSNGNFSITLSGDDNQIISTGRRRYKNPEEHRLLIELTTTTGITLTESIIIQVINIKFKT